MFGNIYRYDDVQFHLGSFTGNRRFVEYYVDGEAIRSVSMAANDHGTIDVEVVDDGGGIVERYEDIVLVATESSMVDVERVDMKTCTSTCVGSVDGPLDSKFCWYLADILYRRYNAAAWRTPTRFMLIRHEDSEYSGLEVAVESNLTLDDVIERTNDLVKWILEGEGDAEVSSEKVDGGWQIRCHDPFDEWEHVWWVMHQSDCVSCWKLVD